MVVSTAQQLPQTYQLWRRFSMPTTGGSVDAIAVPTSVANELNSAYTIMVTSMILSAWAVVIAVGMYVSLRKKHFNVGDISMSVWNKRASPSDSLLDTVLSVVNDWGKWRLYPLIVIIVIVWAATIAASVIIPQHIVIDHAAPVNPNAIYAPSQDYSDSSRLSKVYALDVPSALRAAGSALVANSTLKEKVYVSQPVILRYTADGEAVQRIDYNYTVTGADFGLQHYPNLVFTATGACTTDYEWFWQTVPVSSGSVSTNTDYYFAFGRYPDPTQEIYVSLADGLQPLAYFILGNQSAIGPPGNITWGAIVSSVDRTSFTNGTDPWYETIPNPSFASSNGTAPPYVVKPARPALSCWQNDVWSYNGQTSSVANLTNQTLPGLNLSPALQRIFTRFLGGPKIVTVAQRLSPSMLQSTTTSLGGSFDAGGSSMFNDLQRLILASYIATTNMLTDTTLYTVNAGASDVIQNIALGGSGQVLDGVADFVVWNSDISTLSVKAIIVIPVVSLSCWLVMLLLLYATPLKKSNALDVINFFRDVRENHPSANIAPDEAKWVFPKIESHKTPKNESHETPKNESHETPKISN